MPFFRFEHLMLVMAHGDSFETLACSRKAFSGRPTQGERKTNFLVHFLGSSTSTGQISLRHGFAQSRNQSCSSHKISELHTLPSWCTTDDMTDRQIDRQ